MAQTKPDNPHRAEPDAPSGVTVLRVQVLDTAHPAFRAEARRQAALLRGAAEEEEALRFITAALPDFGCGDPEDAQPRG